MSIHASIPLEQAIDKHPLMMPSDTPVMDAIAAMSQRRATCTLIVEQQKLIGIFTERDVLRITASQMSLQGVAISQVMTKDLITLPLHQAGDIFSLLAQLRGARVCHLPVLDEQGGVLGVITQTSILQALDPVEPYSTIELLQQTIVEKNQELLQANAQLQQEIRDRQWLEAKLIGSELQVRAIFEAMSDIVLVIDQNNSIQIVQTKPTGSPTWDTNLLNLTVNQFLQEETGEIWFAKVQQVLATQQTIDFDYSLHIDDREVWFGARISPLPDRSVVWVARDISERKRAEAAEFHAVHRALRVLSASIRAVARATEESTLLHTVCQLLIDIGEYHLAWIGYVQHDDDKTVQPVAYAGYEAGYLQTAKITWADTERGQGPTGQAIRSGQPSVAQNILTEPNLTPWREEAIKRGYQSSLAIPLIEREQVIGALNLYSTIASAFDSEEVQLLMELADNVSYGILALRTQRDRQRAEESILRLNQELEAKVKQRTTQLAQTNEQLQHSNEQLAILNQEFQRSNQELEQFAYVASHDLQEPLRAVAGYTQLLVNEYRDRLDETALEYADFIVDGAKRMQQLIQDLLTYSRVGTRGQEFAPTDCNAVLQQVLQNLQVAIADNQATITAEPLPTVNGDRNQLVQLLQNLIGNAIKFHRDEPPHVYITAQKQDNDWLFQIQDNGIGIKPQYLERIFEVFKRLHTRREYPGTGIGLAICKKIATRHGGRIWAKSESGVGTIFYFTIPLNLYERSQEHSTD
jgi:signal transduction histidine kinase/CBS domain-containing protein